MMKLSVTLTSAALLLSNSTAFAQTPAPKATGTARPVAAKPAPAVPVKTVVTTTKTTLPVATVKATTVAHSRTTTTSGGGRMVQAKLANGKTVTYNCSLAGNKTKTACK